MGPYLYLLELTDEGDQFVPVMEVNFAMVVRAYNAKQARELASLCVIDEQPVAWLNGRYSTCKRLGVVTPGAPKATGVVLREDNAR